MSGEYFYVDRFVFISTDSARLTIVSTLTEHAQAVPWATMGVPSRPWAPAGSSPGVDKLGSLGSAGFRGGALLGSAAKHPKADNMF